MPVWQNSVDYIRQEETDGVATYFTADSTQYQTDYSSLTPPIPIASVAGVVNTTNYQYVFWTTGDLTSPTIQQETTKLPLAVDVNRDVLVTTVDWYDLLGQLQWEKDGNDSVTYSHYDAVGDVDYQIQDINAATASSHAPPLSVPTNGISAETDSEYDDLHRLTQTLGPPHYAVVDGVAEDVQSASWTVYDDADMAVFSAQGLAQGSVLTLSNPVSVQKSDRDGNVTDTIQATVGIPLGQSAVKWVAPNSLTVNEIAIPSADTPAGLFTKTGAYAIGLPTANTSYTVWTHDVYDPQSDELLEDDAYYAIPLPSGSGTASSGDNEAGANYNATQTFYDNLGRSQATIDPGGTMSYSVFDAQGNVTDTWSGTRGTATISTYANNLAIVEAFRAWLAGHPTAMYYTSGGTDLVKFSHSAYNADSDATATTQYVVSGLTSAARTTNYGFDWRDRQTYAVNPRDGVPDSGPGNVTYTMTTCDNQDEATLTQQYLLYSGAQGSVVSVLAAATADPPTPLDPGVTNNDVLLTQTGSKFDSQGNDYETDNYLVTNGSAPGTPTSSTQSSYDGDGNVHTETDALTNVTTFTFDGLDQQSSETDPDPRPTHDPGSPVTTTVYDADGNLTATIDPLDNVTASAYDDAGNVVAHIRAKSLAAAARGPSATSRPTAS